MGRNFAHRPDERQEPASFSRWARNGTSVAGREAAWNARRMTATPSATPPVRRSRVGQAVALMLLPTAAALGLLLLGLVTTTLAFVYLSIAASVAAVPAFVVGIVMLARR